MQDFVALIDEINRLASIAPGFVSQPVLPDGGIGCLYERGQKSAYERITFARFGLDWLEK